ncbi:MAG: hypothetical protein QGH73_06560 [Rhodospirillales bacterium]|jgi:tripartite-type tricarboxylate transporter receptor subunit TctC|nr:hypothetical protein [Rhodospirillaceae bacterium]MDP6427213.1 hypothetical protein [Rhodospirillales bacterium]MDP6645409.1 hypothetical protein [Rhodospirillales bacterium]MDP6841323.1 hypothetical protein [Rhodospirillales bacterium]
MRIIKYLAAGVAAAALAASLSSSADAQYFKGKTIEFIVPTAAGGGLGRNALRFANFYKKFIAGKPNVIVKFIPGGGGQKGINFVYNRGKKDGTQLTWGPFNVAGIIAGLPGIRYDPEKFEIIGTTGDAFVTIASAGLGSGLKNPVDLVKSGTFKSGGRIPGGALGMFSVMGFDLLGVDYRHITGYRNQPKLKAALMAREIDTITTGSPGFFAFYKDDLLKKGTAKALYYHPPFDVKAGKDAPVADAY